MEARMATKQVKMTLEGLDGNAFMLLGAFQANARQQGWGQDDIDAVIAEATATDYARLLATLEAHIDASGEGR
jgi:hypothetical protein